MQKVAGLPGTRGSEASGRQRHMWGPWAQVLSDHLEICTYWDGKVVGGPAGEVGLTHLPCLEHSVFLVPRSLASFLQDSLSYTGSGPSFGLPHPECIPHPGPGRCELSLSGDRLVSSTDAES